MIWAPAVIVAAWIIVTGTPCGGWLARLLGAPTPPDDRRQP